METHLRSIVTTLNSDTMDADLDAAVHAAEQFAAEDGIRGILVTRLGYTSFSVELTADVPFGQIHERQDFL